MSLCHRHKWKATATTPLTVKRPVVIGGLPMLTFPERITFETVVLYACECGKHRTERLDGTWVMDEMQPSSDSELKELRNMAGIK